MRAPVNELWSTYGISSATYYKWKATYGGSEASDIKRLKELEHEHSRLKHLCADLSLEHAALKDVLAKQVVPHLVRKAAFPFSGRDKPSGSTSHILSAMGSSGHSAMRRSLEP